MIYRGTIGGGGSGDQAMRWALNLRLGGICGPLLSLVLLGGCQTQITMANGAVVSGCIRCADASSIEVVRDRWPRSCGNDPADVERHLRASVRKIDHAGRVQIGLGAAMIGSGAIVANAGIPIVGRPQTGDEVIGPVGIWMFAFGLPAVALFGGGTALLTYGLLSWGDSRKAAEPWGAGCAVPWNISETEEEGP